MRLVDLEAQFVRIVKPGHFEDVDTVAAADGVMFLCPVCFEANAGPIGTHQIICWRPRVPQSEPPTPGRWEFEGSGPEDLTLSPSIHLSGEGCGAHFFVRGGRIV